ncbi:cucumber peeling cupredoxin-like [Benincasa hispida]|uniref:cucumber peeling cupredoxin-like n=1 Tax=Benincasa hispida TaxID=102211 RepID=UPI0018FF36A8|nr:cucumber peeling cupredoxin-like [Benincasa hispida]XP_038885968.1 cucumber peeling cupredoxin-like [Benincasa hispida]
MNTSMSSFACLFFFLGALVHVSVAVEHKVGGNFGWNLPSTPTFFSDWANSRPFFVGDKLIFESRANETHSIGQPESQANFDGCVKPGFFFNKIIFISLDRPGRRYFISTIGNDCNAGMKFAVNVLPKLGTIPNSTTKVGAWPALLFALANIMANSLFFF